MPKNLFIIILCVSISFAFFWSNLPADSQEKKLTLLFAGDIMMHGPQINAATIQKDQVFDFQKSFQYIQPLLEQADLAIGNLELTLPGKPPYSGWPNFKSPDTLAVALAEAGFDILTTANNHSNDGRKSGVTHTIDVLDRLGIHHTGTFKDTIDRALKYPLIIYKNGFKIAFLNYTYGTDKKKNYPPTFVNKIDEKRIRQDIKKAKKMQPDAIIAMMHWGREYALTPQKDEEQLSEQMLEWGVDAIVGGHPHVVQPIKIQKNPDSNSKKVIAYSLGNFISNQQQYNTNGGILLELELEKESDEKARITDAFYSTIYRFIQYPKGKEKKAFFCLPISPFQNNTYLIPGFSFEERAKMLDFDKRMNAHLKATGNCREKRYRLKPNQGITSLYY